MRPLKGKELLEKVKELGDVIKSDLVRACGHVAKKENGEERIQFTAFFEVLLDAKKVDNPMVCFISNMNIIDPTTGEQRMWLTEIDEFHNIRSKDAHDASVC